MFIWLTGWAWNNNLLNNWNRVQCWKRIQWGTKYEGKNTHHMCMVHTSNALSFIQLSCYSCMVMGTTWITFSKAEKTNDCGDAYTKATCVLLQVCSCGVFILLSWKLNMRNAAVLMDPWEHVLATEGIGVWVVFVVRKTKRSMKTRFYLASPPQASPPRRGLVQQGFYHKCDRYQ